MATEHSFDWRIYADATCAGLTALIPLPLIDVLFERYFRRRMPSAIARVRSAELDDDARRRLGGSHNRLLSWAGCLAMPLRALRYLARKLWRKVIYVFAVTDAAGLISEYWHRAFLIDHMARAGHLAPGTDIDRAVAVFRQALREADTGPLLGLARQLIDSTGRVFRMLVRARRRGSVGETETLASFLRSHWSVTERSLAAVAIRYNELYRGWPEREEVDPGEPGP